MSGSKREVFHISGKVKLGESPGKAWGLPVDYYGMRSKTEYAKLKSQLEEKYGKPQEYEVLLPGSIWKNDNEFSISLSKNERIHASEWTTKLPDNINKIRLMITSPQHRATQLGIVYTYKNYENIEKSKTAKEKDFL